MRKIFTIIGTRPEAIKMAPIAALLNNDNKFCHKLICSGQHQEMLDSVLDIFDLTPDYNLQLMSEAQDINDLMSKMITGLSEIIKRDRPDGILVHGDTVTTMIASVVAFYHQIKVYHVEAGLRTGNLMEPWPEEGNRKIVSAVASHHFAPTEFARSNLQAEGIVDNNISVVGNTVIDALYLALDKIKKNKDKILILRKRFNYVDHAKKLIILTCHRRENHGPRLNNIINAVIELANQHSVSFIVPVHPNPNVKQIITSRLHDVNNVYLTEPLAYDEFIYVMQKADIILTDSGGIQEEAPSLGKPVLVLRDVTERQEAISAGTVRLIGTDTDNIVNAVLGLISDKHKYREMASLKNPYGDGKAALRIIGHL
jgi:UDP-N-acetylglucosamine 2-epimerase (non-hydrolysing)